MLSYLRESNSFCIVASNGGREKNPSWYHNLKSNPDCKIQIGKETFSGSAIQIHDEEYIEWWNKMDNMNKGGYSNYQKINKKSRKKDEYFHTFIFICKHNIGQSTISYIVY